MLLAGRWFFRYRVQLDRQGICRSGLLGRVQLSWSDVARVRYKPGGVTQGGPISHKLILYARGGQRIVIRSSCECYEALLMRVRTELASHGLDLERLIAEAEQKGSFVHPHREDLAPALFFLGLTMAALSGALMWLKRAGW